MLGAGAPYVKPLPRAPTPPPAPRNADITPKLGVPSSRPTQTTKVETTAKDASATEKAPVRPSVRPNWAIATKRIVAKQPLPLPLPLPVADDEAGDASDGAIAEDTDARVQRVIDAQRVWYKDAWSLLDDATQFSEVDGSHGQSHRAAAFHLRQRVRVLDPVSEEWRYGAVVAIAGRVFDFWQSIKKSEEESIPERDDDFCPFPIVGLHHVAAQPAPTNNPPCYLIHFLDAASSTEQRWYLQHDLQAIDDDGAPLALIKSVVHGRQDKANGKHEKKHNRSTAAPTPTTKAAPAKPGRLNDLLLKPTFLEQVANGFALASKPYPGVVTEAPSRNSVAVESKPSSSTAPLLPAMEPVDVGGLPPLIDPSPGSMAAFSMPLSSSTASFSGLLSPRDSNVVRQPPATFPPSPLPPPALSSMPPSMTSVSLLPSIDLQLAQVRSGSHPIILHSLAQLQVKTEERRRVAERRRLEGLKLVEEEYKADMKELEEEWRDEWTAVEERVLEEVREARRREEREGEDLGMAAHTRRKKASLLGVAGLARPSLRRRFHLEHRLAPSDRKADVERVKQLIAEGLGEEGRRKVQRLEEHVRGKVGWGGVTEARSREGPVVETRLRRRA